MSTLSDELDKLRSNICHDCKKRLIPGNVSASPGMNASTAILSTSAPFWRRMFQHRLPSRFTVHTGRTSNSAASTSAVPTISPISSETIPGTAIDTSPTNPGPEQTRISPEPDHPEFSVEYNPEEKRALTLHLEHVFTHESPAYCMKISPDGQRMAVGFRYSGTTIISDLKTGSNVRSVSECLFSCLD